VETVRTYLVHGVDWGGEIYYTSEDSPSPSPCGDVRGVVSGYDSGRSYMDCTYSGSALAVF